MKQKLIILFLAILFVSCSEEIYEYQNQTNKDNQISFKQFKAETQITNFELSTSVNLSGQRGRSLPTDFVIDTTKILNCISSTNKKTYTFRIAPISSALESNEFYNLVYKKVDNQWQQLIFKNKEINLSNGKNKLDSSNLVYSSASKNQNSTEGLCTVILAIDNCDGSCSEAGYSHCDGNQCSTGVCSTTYQVTTSDCGSGGGVGGSNSGGTSSPIGSPVTIPVVIPGGGGGAPSVYIPDPIETVFYSNPFDGNDILDPSSNAMTTLKLQIAAFTRELSINNPEIKHLLESDVQFFNILATYFVNNGFTAPNKTFVQNTLIKIFPISQLHFSNFSGDEQTKFAIWAFDYLLQNPTVTLDQFKNWFTGTSEGIDGVYDEAYWENPNLTFPPQNLPTFADFKTACPSKSTTAQVLCNTIIGGNVATMYNAVIASGKKFNTCALRISRALNYSGIELPSLPNNPNGSKNSVTGADGKNYIINAKALNKWMRKTFGTPTGTNHIVNSQGGTKGKDFADLIANKKGIYSMIALQSIQDTWGTGHVDLLENGGCLLDCHFYDLNNQLVPVDYIDIWILN